jgi:hypothetical protein
MEGTSNCIKCGKPARLYGGHIKAKKKMALGNLIDIKISAGWCSEECYNSMESDDSGCYGTYDNMTMGYVENIFR